MRDFGFISIFLNNTLIPIIYCYLEEEIEEVRKQMIEEDLLEISFESENRDQDKNELDPNLMDSEDELIGEIDDKENEIIFLKF